MGVSVGVLSLTEPWRASIWAEGEMVTMEAALEEDGEGGAIIGTGARIILQPGETLEHIRQCHHNAVYSTQFIKELFSAMTTFTSTIPILWIFQVLQGVW